MRVVHVRVSQADFDGIFKAMREWLDRKNCVLEQFETETDDRGATIIKAQFVEDDLAELFRREFQGNYGD
jgi:glycine cleavage system regulatory protein